MPTPALRTLVPFGLALLGACSSIPARGAERPVIRVEGETVEVERFWLSEVDPDGDSFLLCFPAQLLETEAGWRAPEARLRFRQKTWAAGWHLIEGEHGGHSFFEVDAATAEALAEALDVPVARRGPRPYALEASFRAVPEEVRAGDEVTVDLRLTLVSGEPVTFQAGGWERGANRHGRFDFEVHHDGREVPDIDRTVNFGGISTAGTLADDATFHERAVLNRWAKLDRPGTYTIRASYELPVQGTRLPFDRADACPYLLERFIETFTGELEVRVTTD